MDNKVNFLRGTSAEYEGKTKDNDTFYYTTDTKKLYLGETEITGIEIDDTSTTATDKTWSAKKINDSIPTELPADGGNADTVDNKHASDFMQFLGDFRTGSLLDHILSLDKSGFLYCGSANCTDMPVDGSYFMVEVRCYATVREAIATSFSTGAVYTNRYSSSKWSGWHNLADGGNASTANIASTLATTSSNICLRNLSSGTVAATWNTATGTGNCPVGAWYGKHS